MVSKIVLIGAVAAAATALLIGAGIATAQVTTPTVLPDTATTAPGTPVVINVLANDVDPLGSFVPTDDVPGAIEGEERVIPNMLDQ